MLGKKNTQLDTIETLLRVIQVRMSDLDTKLGRLSLQLGRIESAKGETASKMADKLIEMAMVNQGGLKDAVTHRNVSRMDDLTPEATGDAWAEQQDEWPPKDCDTMKVP